MKPILAHEVCEAVGGTPLDPLPAALLRVVSLNTRDTSPGGLFVAVAGDKFDAHDFLAGAQASGCVAALIERDVAPVPGLCRIRVDNTRLALGRLARHVRRSFRARVIAIAGSNGKTGTKVLLDHVLRQSLRGSASPKSFNNDIGVPTTLLSADGDSDYVIVEIGTNHPGEVRPLSLMAEPDMAIVTSIGQEHLEFFGDLDGVREENAHIIDGLRSAGTLISGTDDPLFHAMISGHPAGLVAVGRALPDGFATVSEVSLSLAGTSFRLTMNPKASRASSIWTVSLLGEHNAINAALVIVAAIRMGLEPAAIARALETAPPAEMRLELRHRTLARDGGPMPIHILNDAYNANPTSMTAALKTLHGMSHAGRKVAVLGDMLELGGQSAVLHAQVGRDAAASPPDMLYALGTFGPDLARGAVEAGFPAGRIEVVADIPALAASLGPKLRPEDLILIKASRGVRLERLEQQL